MQMDQLHLIERVTAKTIFEDNVFYMITWKDRDEQQNTWKPSEYFEQNDFLSSLVHQFEEDMKQTEESLFKRLEKDEIRKKENLSLEEQIDRRWGGASYLKADRLQSNPRDNLIEPEADLLPLRGQASTGSQVNVAVPDFKKFGHLKFNRFTNAPVSQAEQMQSARLTQIGNAHGKNLWSTNATSSKPAHQMENPSARNNKNFCEERRPKVNTQKQGTTNQAAQSTCSAQNEDIQGEGRSLQKKRLAMFYELELREKVYDFKNYGQKVLSDLKVFSDPARAKRLMSVRHGAMFKKSVNNGIN